jgi:hypothetical protein
MDLLSRIYRHLKTSGESRTAFGRRTMNDPRFVWDLENGRIPNMRTRRRIAASLDRQEGAPQ